MATTEATPKVATSSNHAALRKTVFLLLRMAIGIAILVYLAKSGQINFASLIRLLHAWPLTLTAVLFLQLLYIDALLAAFMLVSAGVVMFFAPTRSWVPSLMGRWPGIKNLALRVLDAMAVHGKDRGTLFFAFLLSLLANLVLVVVTALGLYAVNPVSFSTRLALVAPIGHLVNSLPLTPGGIGIGETAFTALFRLTGINGGAETLLCVRLWNVLVGLLGLLVYLFGMQRSVYPYAEEVGGAEAGYIGAESTN
jgi:uncharacterized membrane protein YbhN (UPF0104 family)